MGRGLLCKRQSAFLKKKKARKIAKNFFSERGTNIEKEDRLNDWVNRHYKHLKSCSCYYCGNPRRVLRGKDKLTVQELRSELDKI